MTVCVDFNTASRCGIAGTIAEIVYMAAAARSNFVGTSLRDMRQVAFEFSPAASRFPEQKAVFLWTKPTKVKSAENIFNVK